MQIPGVGGRSSLLIATTCVVIGVQRCQWLQTHKTMRNVMVMRFDKRPESPLFADAVSCTTP